MQRFLLAFTALFAGFAQAADPLPESPALDAQTQCRLLLRAADPAWPPSDAELAVITGNYGLFSPNGDIGKADGWRFTTGNLPDFGFLLGASWDAITLSDRKRFNRAVVQFIIRKYGLEKVESYQESCLMDASILTVQEAETDTGEGSAIYPALPLYRTLARSKLPTPGADEDHLVVVYVLDKPWKQDWRMKDVLLGNRSLSEAYASSLQFTLRDKGMDGVVEMLGQ